MGSIARAEAVAECVYWGWGGGFVNVLINPLMVRVSSMLMESEPADYSVHLVVPEIIDVSREGYVSGKGRETPLNCFSAVIYCAATMNEALF